jgi:hypothetical protein
MAANPIRLHVKEIRLLSRKPGGTNVDRGAIFFQRYLTYNKKEERL